jgi:hypothetical protein
MANEAVSKYHYPSLVVGNLVTIPKSGEEETKNVVSRVTFVDAGPPVGVGYGVPFSNHHESSRGNQRIKQPFHVEYAIHGDAVSKHGTRIPIETGRGRNRAIMVAQPAILTYPTMVFYF